MRTKQGTQVIKIVSRPAYQEPGKNTLQVSKKCSLVLHSKSLIRATGRVCGVQSFTYISFMVG